MEPEEEPSVAAAREVCEEVNCFFNIYSNELMPDLYLCRLPRQTSLDLLYPKRGCLSRLSA